MHKLFQTVNNVTQAHRVNEVNAFATFPIVYNTEGRCSYCGRFRQTI